MASPDRTVRQLRLRARDEQAVRRLLPTLDDALRCASLPDAGERLILVRRLALGPLRPGWPAQRLSQRIEARWRAQAAAAPEGRSDAADCVVFDSHLAACTELARRLLAGEPCREWYWRLAVPGVVESPTVAQALLRVADALARRPEAALALPAWAGALMDAGCGEALVRAVGRPVLDAWLGSRRAPSTGEAAVRRDPGGATAPVEPAGPEGAAVGVEQTLEWSDNPSPAPWPAEPTQEGRPAPGIAAGREGAASWPTARAPHGAPGPRKADAARNAGSDAPSDPAAPAPSLAPGRRAPAHRPQPPDGRPPAGGPGSPGAGAAAGSAAREGLPATPVRLASPDRRAAMVDDPGAAATGLAPSPGWPTADPGEPTAHGGLLFLLPVLARLGLPDWLGAEPQHPDEPPGAFAGMVLKAALLRLRTNPDAPADAMQAALGAAALQPDDPARAWLQASRHWLRRQAGIGLASLVRRPARVAVTPTHVDVFFDLDAVDLRVRRHGLDIDPGWLPWFGRVVSFHYGRWSR